MSLKFWAHAPFYYLHMDRPYADLVDEMIDIAQAAEDLGFEGMSIPENLFQNYICNPSALQFASAVAARTTTLKLLTGVIVLPQYHPLVIGSEIAFLDQLSRGRLSVGVARGGNRYPTDRTGVNADHLRGMYEESLEVLERVWTEDNVTYAGEFYSFPETTLVPKPYTQPHPPLWIAAQSTDGVKAVAAAGRNLITSPNLGDFAPMADIDDLMATFNEAASASGHVRGEVMVLRHMYLHEDEAQALAKLPDVILHWNHYMATVQGVGKTTAERLAARQDRVDGILDKGRIIPAEYTPESQDIYADYDDPILTTPEKAVQRFKHYQEIGIDHVTGVMQMGFSADEVIRSMELMSKRVLPEFADTAASA